MPEPSVLDVTSPIPHSEYQVSTLGFEDALMLPPECYSSQAFYEFEQKVIFDREWLCVGRVDQIPNNGDYFTIDLVGEPLLVVRGQDGEVRVLSAVCQHRAVLVAEGAGNCSHFRCPYHWWTYTLEGRLVSGPEMGKTRSFDRKSIALPSLNVEIWNGFIFCSFAENPPPLAPQLEGISKLLSNYNLPELVSSPAERLASLPFNWKVMMENGLEGYHGVRLHNKFASSSGVYEWDQPPADPGAVMVPFRMPVMDRGLNPTKRTLLPVITGLTDEERHITGFACVMPNLMLGWEADWVYWFLLLPEGPDHVTLQWHYCVERSTRDMVLFDHLLQMVRDGVGYYNDEDLPVATATQRGMHSRFARRGSYSCEEEVLVQVNRWLVGRYLASRDPAAG